MEDAKLTFGDLEVGDHFIGFPMPGDNSGHGGYLRGEILFKKQRASGEWVPINSGTAVNGRGVCSHFPDTMPVLKIIVE